MKRIAVFTVILGATGFAASFMGAVLNNWGLIAGGTTAWVFCVVFLGTLMDRNEL